MNKELQKMIEIEKINCKEKQKNNYCDMTTCTICELTAIYKAGYRKADEETKAQIIDLLIEFDEMTYQPMTLCENPEEEAINWKKRLVELLGTIIDFKGAEQ